MSYKFINVIKVSEKLFDNGFDTEEKIKKMEFEDLDKIPKLQSYEAKIILELKNAIKNRNLIAFLSNIKHQKD